MFTSSSLDHLCHLADDRVWLWPVSSCDSASHVNVCNISGRRAVSCWHGTLRHPPYPSLSSSSISLSLSLLTSPLSPSPTPTLVSSTEPDLGRRGGTDSDPVSPLPSPLPPPHRAQGHGTTTGPPGDPACLSTTVDGDVGAPPPLDDGSRVTQMAGGGAAVI